jgi:adenylyltransferase/sulfurtransferase
MPSNFTDIPPQFDPERYGRHLRLPEVGTTGQKKIAAAKVLVVGMGGLGHPAATYLVGAGVGTLGIVDHDRVERSNLHRQILFTPEDIGRTKVDAALDRLGTMDSGTRLVPIGEKLTAENAAKIIEPFNLIIDCTDNFAARYLLNDCAVLYRKPLVHAAIDRFAGHVTFIAPPETPCYRCLFPTPDYGKLNCAEAGVLGVLPGIVGTLQATEALKWIIGAGDVLARRLLTFDALKMSFRTFDYERDSDCAACGTEPSIHKLEAAGHSGSGEPRLTAEELWQLLDQNAPVTLIDVREPWETASGTIPTSQTIPLANLEKEPLDHLDKNRLTVVFCQSGVRSARALASLRAKGLTNLRSLEGGIAAWNQFNH